MKKIVFTILGLLISASILFADGRHTIAIYLAESNEFIRPFVTKLTNLFLDDYDIVVRSEELQKIIDQEFSYQNSGKVDLSQLAMLGKQSGSDFVCVVTMRKDSISSKYYYELYLINVEKATIVNVSDYTSFDISVTSQLTAANNIYRSIRPNNCINGYEYVDMGLSVLWAKCNVGALSQDNIGNYYSWGETQVNDSQWSSQSSESLILDISGLLQYDAARANWGSSWRMPTIDEWQELIDNCNWTYVTANGKTGFMAESKINGAVLFFPTTGYKYRDESYTNRNDRGWYWSSSPYSDTGSVSVRLTSSSPIAELIYDWKRAYRYCIRPVSN